MVSDSYTCDDCSIIKINTVSSTEVNNVTCSCNPIIIPPTLSANIHEMDYIIATKNAEKLRAIAKRIIKDREISKLKKSWSQMANLNIKENSQTKQPIWLNHKINSDRG